VEVSTKKYLEERRQKKQRQNNILVIIMIAGVVLVVAAFVLAFISSSRIEIPEFTDYEQSGLSALGDPNAPVIIEEFSDFGCTHCADFALGTKKLIEEEYINTGKVYLVFHSVGGLLGSAQTLQAAEASYCAGEQEAFWPYHDLLFTNQFNLFANQAGDISKTLSEFAKALDLNQDQFDSCLAERTYQDLAAEDQEFASQNGVTGTPAFLINGVLLRGNQPYENFQQAIEEALASVID
ncbi:MAG: DsbA family protein, partial [Chloroflexi bacterium]|nr:DsbA family protein [Chloroflexota bacterium]